MPRYPLPFRPELGVVLFAGLIFLQMLGVAAAGSWLDLHAADVAAMDADARLRAGVLGRVGAYAAILPLAAWMLARDRAAARRSDAPSRPSLGRALLVGAAGLLLLWPILMALGLLLRPLVGWLTGTEPDPLAHDTLRDFTQSDDRLWSGLMAAMVVLAAPAVEEFLYRGTLQRALRSAGAPAALAIPLASLLFTLVHVGAIEATAINALVPLFVLSVGLGVVYERTGRLAAPIALHALFNAANLALLASQTARGN